MRAPHQPEAGPDASHTPNKLWLAIFVLIAVLVYSPWIAPPGRYEPFIVGLPFTVFWWMLLSLALLVSIMFFVLFAWREDEGEEGGED